jgi:putative transposase
MPQSHVQVYLHIIFSTKHRKPWIVPGTRPKLAAYFGGIFRECKSPLLSAGIVDDHVHLLCMQHKGITVINLVEQIKTGTSKWMKGQVPAGKAFYWQSGYAAFSVSASRIEAVTKYLAKQEAHHKRITFQDELRKFFQEYKIQFDERYVWD